jgi:type III secretory pathway lipoprotein EscJ
MREIIKQFIALWADLKPIQKMTAALVMIFVGGALMAMIMRSTSSGYVSLYPSIHLQGNDLAEVRHYLEQYDIPFKEESKKGILVPEEHVERVRMELAMAGALKHDQGKGFELFDTNTWIKGEKELQVLEMRALKGQLEKDLSGFDQIKSASVILDLAPSRSLGAPQYKTKASVILTLMQGARLSASQLRAISHHLAGAVRGLEPNRIAISDTTGRLYQAINPEGEEEIINCNQVIFEEHFKEKVDQMLSKTLGEEHFFSTAQAILAGGQVASLSMHILIDQALLEGMDPTSFETEINKQLAAIANGSFIPVEIGVDFFPFKKKGSSQIKKEKSGSKLGFIIGALILAALGFAFYFFLFQPRREKSQSEVEDPLLEIMTGVDLDKLARSIQGEDPETIAEMLSYLQPARAEQLILAFPEGVQEQILFHLTEMEKEGI